MYAGDHQDVMAILAWIPPADRDRITEILCEIAGTDHGGWTLINLAQAAREHGRRPRAAAD